MKKGRLLKNNSVRSHFAAGLNKLLNFWDLRRHYQNDYNFYDSTLHSPPDSSYLFDVPSQTTVRERMYLYNYFRFNWRGGKVVEFGPFLGGTTRAVALGMSHSSFGSAASSTLLTIDEFDGYATREDLLKIKVPESLLDVFEGFKENNRVPFKKIFDYYIENQPYTKLVDARKIRLPEFPIQDYDIKTWNEILDDGHFDESLEFLFIDGAKSYYSLYFILSQFASCVSIGSKIAFQDYLKISCWWIPLIMGSLTQFFRVESIVDSTVIFVCVKPLVGGETLRKSLPAEVSKIPSVKIEECFKSEFSMLISEYSKKLQAVNRLQKQAALVDSGKQLTSTDLVQSIKLFPRTVNYVSEFRKIRRGRYNQK